MKASDQFTVGKYCLAIAVEMNDLKMKDSYCKIVNCGSSMVINRPSNFCFKFAAKQHYYVQITFNNGTYSAQCNGYLFCSPLQDQKLEIQCVNRSIF